MSRIRASGMYADAINQDYSVLGTFWSMSIFGADMLVMGWRNIRRHILFETENGNFSFPSRCDNGCGGGISVQKFHNSHRLLGCYEHLCFSYKFFSLGCPADIELVQDGTESF